MSAFNNLGGTPFGTLTMAPTSINGLGLTPSKIFSGDAKGPLDTGTKVIIDVTGAMEGAVSGSFSGSDYANVQDGVVSVNCYGTLVTGDGDQIAVRILGEVRDGQMQADVQLRNYGTLAHLNSKRLLGTGTMAEGGCISLTLYESDAEAPFADPDLSTVDYANFPFTLEDVKANPDAQSVYSGEGRLLGAHSFGVDVMAIFGGQVQIPDEGIRLNGYFAGPAAGGVNGVILGRNFQTVGPDGASHINSKIIVRTFDGDTLLVEAQGGMFPQTGASWWETNRTVSNLPRYAEAARRYNVGIGSTDVQSGHIVYNHYSLPENPFA